MSTAEHFATPERKALRATVRRFVEREVAPHLDGWERAGELPRALHERAGQLGLLGIGFAEAVGGSGGDLIDGVVLTEELIAAGGSSGLCAGLLTHAIALPHIVAAGDPSQLHRFVAPTLAGKLIGSLAITEPDGGSDVAGLRTTARREVSITSSTAPRPTSPPVSGPTSSPPRCGPAAPAPVASACSSLRRAHRDSP